MEMLIRTVFFFLLYLKCRIIYRKQVYFRGFSVVCAMKGSNILFNNAGGENQHILPSIQQYVWIVATMYYCGKKRWKDSHQRRSWDEWVYHLLNGKHYHRAQY